MYEDIAGLHLGAFKNETKWVRKKYKRRNKKIKNNNLQPRSEKRETGSGISPASIRVLIDD
jgi:hypothetical protein